MGVRPNTGNTFKGFTFDGIDSKTYGVYITQEAAYGAPERDVEMISIAGRNGAYALDKGRFLNTTVTYKAGITATDEASFAAAIRDFRNALASRRGYCRLEDDYNTDEYRLAVYKSGLEVSARDILKAGEFTISFDCQPQRFLKSGETAVSLTSGDTLTNPTLFPSRPLFEVVGNGSINVGEHTITLDSIPVGYILLGNKISISKSWSSGTGLEKVGEILFDSEKLNAGDSIYLDATTWSMYFTLHDVWQDEISAVTISTESGTGTTTWSRVSDNSVNITTTIPPQELTAGTAATIEKLYMWSVEGTSGYETGAYDTVRVVYDGSGSISLWAYRRADDRNYSHAFNGSLGAVNGDSTVTMTGTIYIDADTGEAYWYKSGVLISANSAVSFGGELPELEAGNNLITYDNTVTQLRIIPNWWRV